MKMKKFSKVWFIVYFLLWLFIDTGVYYTNKLDEQEQKYREALENRNTRIVKLTERTNSSEKEYRETLNHIVLSLCEKERYQTGGVNINQVRAEEIDHLIEAIQNQTEDFNQYLQYVENFFSTRAIIKESIPCIFPVEYHENVRITSPYGVRYYPLTNKLLFHDGIDISGDADTEILSTAKGKVCEVWARHPIYGKMVKIDHGNGYITMYAHLKGIYCWCKKDIKQGEVIGVMGSTGRSSGRHLHYEIQYNGKPVNPIDYLNSNFIKF
jgi:murein DD-endopeptidase MepM/ murein hydrolase activator NlpD